MNGLLTQVVIVLNGYIPVMEVVQKSQSGKYDITLIYYQMMHNVEGLT